MSQPEPPDDLDRPRSFGVHPADATIVRIAERLLATPPGDAIWREAAALNAAQRPLAAALQRGDITTETYLERLRIVAGPVFARDDQMGTAIFVAATMLLGAEAAASPRPDCPN